MNKYFKIIINAIIVLLIIAVIVLFAIITINYFDKPDTEVYQDIIDNDNKIKTIEVTRDSLILKVNTLDSIKNEEINKVKTLDNDSTLNLFYKLINK